MSWPDHFLHIGDAASGTRYLSDGTAISPLTNQSKPPVSDPGGGTPYQMIGADAQGLAIQSQPRVNHVMRYVPNGTTLKVSCQTKKGDQADGRTLDGRPFTTWDELTDGSYVFDWYLRTPFVGTDRYSPGLAHCTGG